MAAVMIQAKPSFYANLPKTVSSLLETHMKNTFHVMTIALLSTMTGFNFYPFEDITI